MHKLMDLLRLINRQRGARVSHRLAVAVAVSLPWSTTVTGFLIVAWLVVILTTLTMGALRRELASAAGGLPVVLWLLAALGMLWTDASWAERLHGLENYHKLLLIPFLLAQYRGNDKGWQVGAGFLLSCTVLLTVSWGLYATDARPRTFGVPTKDNIAQSGFFVLAAFVVAYLAIDDWRLKRFVHAFLFFLLALLFLINIAFVASARTALVIIPILVVLLAIREFRGMAVIGVLAAGSMLAAVVWTASPYLRDRSLSVVDEVRGYTADGTVSSTALRLEFYRKSIDLIADAPLLGHGTGAIEPMFRRSIVGQTGLAAMVAANPHQQTLAVALELGLVGAALLWAMWIAHLLLFRGGGVVAWFGLVIVLQNVVGSLFNSHLFDFTQGWTYVFGVGVAGGMMLRSAGAAPQAVVSPMRTEMASTPSVSPRS